MCVICVKRQGVQMPTIKNVMDMWKRNPDGAGYMYVRDGKLIIRKGFTDVQDFMNAIYDEDKLTKNDVAVFHFRISTQANNPTMTHPFALTPRIEETKYLNIDNALIGVAHNGIIQLTSDHREQEYSDTALFVANYMTRIIRKPRDLKDPYCKSILQELIGYSKLAMLDVNGDITLIGSFEERNGLLYSNLYHEPIKYSYYNGKKITNKYVKNAVDESEWL